MIMNTIMMRHGNRIFLDIENYFMRRTSMVMVDFRQVLVTEDDSDESVSGVRTSLVSHKAM